MVRGNLFNTAPDVAIIAIVGAVIGAFSDLCTVCCLSVSPLW